MRVFAIAAASLLVGIADANAQTVTDPVYARAQGLVSEGQGAAGRALVDSMYRSTAPGSGERAEALFWRATLAPTAADAERDYRAIVVDHATSPRVEDALLRLAQLELARGDRDGALRHLQRLATEFPGSRQNARTSYWTARVLFEKSDIPAACAANAEALARAAATDVELRNQIEYQQQRCGGAVTAATTPVAPPSTPRDATPSIPVDAPVIRPAAPSAAARTYSVQVAATSTRAAAQTIVNRMSGRGYQARIDGTAAPFRVRVGRYDTRAAATRVLNEMKAKGIDGFIAIIEGR
ncbi:MAG: SPOR domain-containing protein [Gemmatimonadaceae bacterium]